ncbi:hypothetical protein PENSPDRAFT_603150 [Peniophora sp. CONT]|nr:hypothetical protein PENSPDRAFT_603150 [Peniophora sp. CONT]
MASYTKKDVRTSIRHLAPAWFAANMGTGSISILFANYPYGNTTLPMQALSTVFFFLNLFLFVALTTASAYRYLRYPDIWRLMIHHPVQSLFLGCFPMGAATLISVASGVLYTDFGFGGTPFLYFLWACWWLDSAISAACVFWLVHIMFTRHQHDIQKMTSLWLLPVVTFIVASATGGALLKPLHAVNPYHAHITLAVSLVMVAIGISLALMILTLYLLRLIVHGLPEGASILSVFIPLGPTGQSGYSILLIAQAAPTIFPFAGSESRFLGSAEMGQIVFGVCVCTSLVLWSLATMWLVFALVGLSSTLRRTQKGFPFKVPFWGMIFPNGVYANLTIQLYRVLDVEFFRVWGAMYAAATLCLWVVVFGKTVAMVRHGYVFEAPCLEGIDLGTNIALAESSRRVVEQMAQETEDAAARKR